MFSGQLTALEMVQQIASRLKTAYPTTIEDDTTTENRFLLGSLNASLADAVSAYDWNELKLTGAIAIAPVPPLYVAAVDGYDLTTLSNGFSRLLDKTLIETQTGDVYSFCDIDEYRLSQTVPLKTRKFTIRSKCICFANPQPNLASTFKFDYKTNNAVYDDAQGLASVFFQIQYRYFKKNTDMCVLDDELLIKGGVVKYKTAQGQNAQIELNDYSDYLNYLKDTNSNTSLTSAYNQRTNYASTDAASAATTTTGGQV
jgi:hypothetical protein